MTNIERLYNQFIQKVKSGYYRKHGIYWTRKYGAIYSKNLKDKFN